MSLIPPQPVGVLPGSGFWNDWIEKIRFVVNNISQGLINHNDLQNIQGGNSTERYHLTAAQQTDLTDGGDSTSHFHANDRSRANHTGTQTMSTISDLPTLAHGTYTPTLTNGTNVSASTAYQCQYLRVGNTVTVSGKFDVTATAATTITNLGISLPVASNFSAPENCGGTTSSQAIQQAGAIRADATNDRAEVAFLSVDTTSRAMLFSFTYRII